MADNVPLINKYNNLSGLRQSRIYRGESTEDLDEQIESLRTQHPEIDTLAHEANKKIKEEVKRVLRERDG